MREKIYNTLKKLYGILMTVSFFGGIIPLVPFIIAIIVGGTTGEAIALFLYQKVYVWIIAVASIAVLVGLVAMYVGKKQSLSIKKINNK